MIVYKVNQGVKKLKSKTAIILSTITLAISGLGFSLAVPLTAHAAGCTTVSTSKGSLTAAQVGGNVTGDLDATGCDIGAYFNASNPGSVNDAQIHDANKYDVFVDGNAAGNTTVNVTNSEIYNVGNHSGGVFIPNGVQTGVGVYYYGFNTVGTLSGSVSNNSVHDYQKGGIVANGSNATAEIRDNTVAGLGPVSYIAQNGIQVGYGANAQVMSNTVTGNSYTGSNNAASGGVLVVGGACYGGDYTTGTQIVKNTIDGNDVGVWLSNVQADCVSAPKTQTNIKAVNNTISNDGLNNVSGNGFPVGYQAGIADQGNNDKLINNKISGAGYDPASSSSSIFTTWVDANSSFTNNAKVHANKFQ